MHEMSIIRFTLDAVEQAAAEAGLSRVRDITIVTGELRAVVPEQMSLAFRILANDHPMFDSAHLTIESRPVRLRCSDCGQEYDSSLQAISGACCECCGSSRYEIASGQELYIASFTGEGTEKKTGNNDER